MRETLAQGGRQTPLTKPTALSSFPPGAPSVTQEGVPSSRYALFESAFPAHPAGRLSPGSFA